MSVDKNMIRTKKTGFFFFFFIGQIDEFLPVEFLVGKYKSGGAVFAGENDSEIVATSAYSNTQKYRLRTWCPKWKTNNT